MSLLTLCLVSSILFFSLASSSQKVYFLNTIYSTDSAKNGTFKLIETTKNEITIQTKSPEIISILPEKINGPIDGGTNLIIYGQNFAQYSKINVTLKFNKEKDNQLTCPINLMTDKLIGCKTPNVSLPGEYSINIKMSNNGETNYLTSMKKFKYCNVSVNSFTDKIRLSGFSQLLINGTDLDCGSNRNIYIAQEPNGSVVLSKCQPKPYVTNKQIICTTSKIKNIYLNSGYLIVNIDGYKISRYIHFAHKVGLKVNQTKELFINNTYPTLIEGYDFDTAEGKKITLKVGKHLSIDCKIINSTFINCDLTTRNVPRYWFDGRIEKAFIYDKSKRIPTELNLKFVYDEENSKNWVFAFAAVAATVFIITLIIIIMRKIRSRKCLS